jgi:hypothetical protein
LQLLDQFADIVADIIAGIVPLYRIRWGGLQDFRAGSFSGEFPGIQTDCFADVP